MARSQCPYCGAALPAKAQGCPECGSDDSTGWAPEETQHEAAWTEDEDESYQEVIRSLPGGGGEKAGRSSSEITLAIIALIALAAFLFAFVF